MGKTIILTIRFQTIHKTNIEILSIKTICHKLQSDHQTTRLEVISKLSFNEYNASI